MSESHPANPQSLDIELPEVLAEGAYVNFSIVAHSETEFVIDFVRMLPGLPKARVKSRIVFNPLQSKQFLRLMEHQVKVYEKQFGSIDLPGEMVINVENPVGKA